MSQPLFPELEVDLEGQQAKPTACIAVVRRALQRAGHQAAARRFTRDALASGPDEVLPVARRYLRVRS